MDAILSYEILDGRTLGDVLTIEFLASVVGGVIGAILILLVGLLFARFVRRRIANIGFKSPNLDDSLFRFLGDIAWYVVMAFAVLIVLNTFGIQTTSIVAIIGAAGLAIGLALQGTLSNIAAGVMLILFRPIKTGDFVIINGVMGTVKDISLNYTEIADMGNVQIIVPNAEVWGQTITNYSVYDLRRIEWTFGVGYGANLAEAERVIRETIMADERSHAEPEPFLQVKALNDSSVDFLVRVWCDAAVAFQYQCDMTRKVKEALDAAGIEIPFPARTLYYPQPQAQAAE